MERTVYNICEMCSVRCPILVKADGDRITWLEGNPYYGGVEGAMCAKGSGGAALQKDTERPQHPMIRTGPRGSGQWRRATWDEAYDHIAEKTKAAIEKHGARSVLACERPNPNSDLTKTFIKALGSPNYFTHDSVCKGSLSTAARAVTGYKDSDIGLDLKNAKHVILYGRNIFEALGIKELNNLMDGMASGGKLTYIDSRATVTASKADRFLMIRPGTDLALNLALIHVILKENLYDAEYVNRWCLGLSELRAYVEPFTPAWGEKETTVPANEIVSLAREIAQARPAVVFHPGWRVSSYTWEFYIRQTIYILNALMGSIECKGGLFIKKGLKDAGKKSLKNLADAEFPKTAEKRFDGVGWKYPIADADNGLAHILPSAIMNEDPYPLKVLFVYRYDPAYAIPDTQAVKKALDKLDLVVAIDVNFSETAWHADVILPEAHYLERTDPLFVVKGQKPHITIRNQAVPPRYDSRPAWSIYKALADRLGIGKYFPYKDIDDLIELQLKDTDIKRADIEKKGFLNMSDKEILMDRAEGLKFKTPSGKIEFLSGLLEKNGYPSFPEYKTPDAVPDGSFRLTVGRCAVYTHGSTTNNLYLNEIMPENVLWINKGRAAKLGIKDGGSVEVTSSVAKGNLKARLTDYIHPEAVFMLHGFGKQVGSQTRCLNKGVSDGLIQENVMDMVGGSPALQHTLVTVKPV